MENGWGFNGLEYSSTSDDIKSALHANEAITYRHFEPVTLVYEYNGMITEIIKRLFNKREVQ